MRRQSHRLQRGLQEVEATLPARAQPAVVSSDTEKDRGKQRVLQDGGVRTREASAPAVLSQARRY